MQIVSQSVPIFHFQFLALPVPRLPTIAGLLCAPKIAGLLVARVPSSPPMKPVLIRSTKLYLAPAFFTDPATSTEKLIEVTEYTEWLLKGLSKIIDPQQHSEYVRMCDYKYKAVDELHKRLPDDVRFQRPVSRPLMTPEQVRAMVDGVVGRFEDALNQTSSLWADRPSRRSAAQPMKGRDL